MPAAAARIVTLDILRGLAVMGILLMNIASFALPDGAYFNPDAVAVHGRWDTTIWAADFILIDGKFRNIFSLLFGAGILLVLDGARAAGRDEGTVHIRRMAVLGIFGLAHGYLVWRGDILFQYAVVGALLLFLADRRPATLAWLGLGSLVLHAAIAFGTLTMLADMRTDPALWAEVAPQIGGVDRTATAATIARMTGGYGALLHDRFIRDGDLPFVGLITNGFETAGLMLIGMAAFRSGFTTGRWPRRQYRRITFLGCAVALPAMAALALWCIRRDFDPLVAFGVATLWSLPFRPLLALAYIALAVLWIGDGTGGVRTRIGAVGRAAFTNYLGTSLLMTTLFYGYGLGLFGRLDRLSLLGVVAIGWALMLLWSKPWLDRHLHGPLEWVWRTLATDRRRSPE